MQCNEFEGKSLIITGAAGGIGEAAIKGFSDKGAKLFATFNNKEPSSEIAGLAEWHQCDLSIKADVTQLFNKIGKQAGGLNALVNIAGLWRESPEDFDDDHIDFLIDTNLKSAIYTNLAAFNLMKEQKSGRIINFGSVEGMEGNARSPVYATCKGAVHAWTRSVALRWATHNITVNTVAPAMISPGFELSLSQLNEQQREQMFATLKARIPLGGMLGEPLKDCIPLLLFLSGEGSKFITGQLISVDGGLHMVGA